MRVYAEQRVETSGGAVLLHVRGPAPRLRVPHARPRTRKESVATA